MDTPRPVDPAAAFAFVHAIAALDFAALEAVLSPSIRFRALVPTATRRASTASGTRLLFENWFDGALRVEVVALHVDPIAGRLHIGYRLQVHDHVGSYLLEQHGFGDVASGRLSSLALVCSGFLQVPHGEDGADSGS